MPSFAVNRKQMNRGCGNGSGRWLFEEFMISDSVFGRVEIEYRVSHYKEIHMDRTERVTEIDDVQVASLVVYDDDGNEVPVSPEDYAKLSQIAIEAFVEVRDDVIDYERERL